MHANVSFLNQKQAVFNVECPDFKLNGRPLELESEGLIGKVLLGTQNEDGLAVNPDEGSEGIRNREGSRGWKEKERREEGQRKDRSEEVRFSKLAFASSRLVFLCFRYSVISDAGFLLLLTQYETVSSSI